MLTSNGLALRESPDRLGPLEPVPVAVRGDRPALWERLRRDGYLYLPGALDPEAVTAFRRYYFSSLADVGLVAAGSDPTVGRDSGRPLRQEEFRSVLFDKIVPGAAYAEFCGQPAIRDWFAWLYEDTTFLHRRKIIRHGRPGEIGIGTATQAHYDLVYLREGTNHVLSCWIPLGDCPVRRGGLVYLERTHHTYVAREARGARLPPASLDANLARLADQHDARWLVADYTAGDMVVHSPYIVHASLDNVDPDGVVRLSTDIRYQRAGDPIDWRWQHDWHDRDGL